jgi:hypothetical protein
MFCFGTEKIQRISYLLEISTHGRKFPNFRKLSKFQIKMLRATLRAACVSEFPEGEQIN